MAEIGSGQRKLVIDVVGATPKGRKRPSALLYVWDYTANERKEAWGSDADYDDLEKFGVKLLESHDIEFLGTRRIAIFGEGGVEVLGMLGDEGFSLRMMRRDHRHFEVRCVGPLDQPEWPCASAFKAFTISEPPARPAPEGPHVLHLREPRFGVELDAPDDSWLATGPSSGAGGAQLVWTWRNADRQFDLQVMDFRGLPAEPSEQQFLFQHAEFFRSRGAKVVFGEALLGGERCHHLQVKRSDGWYTDLFLLHRHSINYTVMISQRKRDPKLIARVTNGLRFTPLENVRERTEARLTREGSMKETSDGI